MIPCMNSKIHEFKRSRWSNAGYQTGRIGRIERLGKVDQWVVVVVWNKKIVVELHGRLIIENNYVIHISDV